MCSPSDMAGPPRLTPAPRLQRAMRKWTQGELGTALRNLKQRVPHFAGGSGGHNKENQQAPTAAEHRRRTLQHGDEVRGHVWPGMLPCHLQRRPAPMVACIAPHHGYGLAATAKVLQCIGYEH